MRLTRVGAAVSITAALAPWMLLPAHQAGGPVATPPRIGYLGLRPMAEQLVPLAGLKEGLRDLGYVEGKDYVLEIRVVDNTPARYPELTRELTQLGVKLIVAPSTPAAVAIHKENPAMPVVVRGPDIVGAGLAKSAAHPAGVVTGIDELLPGESGTRRRLLKQIGPDHFARRRIVICPDRHWARHRTRRGGGSGHGPRCHAPSLQSLPYHKFRRDLCRYQARWGAGTLLSRRCTAHPRDEGDC